MNRKPVPLERPFGFRLIAALSSFVMGTSLLGGVTGLFLSKGTPFAHAIIAERACADYVFASQRERCMQSLPTSSHLRGIASR
jgi:hypothetical protein